MTTYFRKKVLILFWCEADFDFASSFLEDLINESKDYDYEIVDSEPYWIGDKSSYDRVNKWILKNELGIIRIPQKLKYFNIIYSQIEKQLLRIPLISHRKVRIALYSFIKSTVSWMIRD